MRSTNAEWKVPKNVRSNNTNFELMMLLCATAISIHEAGEV
jgi:hypothetical protein